MVKAPRSMLRTIAKSLPAMDVLQNLPLLMKMTFAMVVDHQMYRLWTRNPHHIAHAFIQPLMK